MSDLAKKGQSPGFEFISCRLCSADKPVPVMKLKDRFYGLEGEFQLVKCSGCGLFYLNPRPSPEYMSKYYPENYYSYEEESDIAVKTDFSGLSGWVRKQIIQRENLIGEILWLYFVKIKSNWRWFYAAGGLGRNQSVLEVGSGAGKTLRFFKKFGWKAMGVEISEKAVLEGKKSGVEIFRGDLSSQEIPRDSVDLIWMSHVFEHVHDPHMILSEARKILKADGRIFMEIPAADAIQPWFFGAFCPVWDAPRHLFIYTAKTLREIALQNGFEMKVLGRYCSEQTAMFSLKLMSLENGFVGWVLKSPWRTGILSFFLSLLCGIGQLLNLGETLDVELIPKKKMIPAASGIMGEVTYL